MASPNTQRRFGLVGNVAIKAPCLVATTANITLSGEQTIDGVACVSGDRVLVKDQTNAVNNGIYVVDTGAWTRDYDFNGPYDVVTGTIIVITSGTSNSNTSWRVSTTGIITIGTTSISFASATFTNSASIAYLPAGTGAVATTVQAKIRRISVDVQDYGAAVDGVTDDYAAIQMAITYLNSVGGGVLTVPAGTSMLSQRVTGQTGIDIVGVPGQSIWKATAGNTDTVQLFALNTETNITITGMVFDGNSGSIGSANPLTQIFNCQNIILENNVWQNTKCIALNLSTTLTNLTVRNNRFYNIAFANGVGGTGFYQAIALSGTGHYNHQYINNYFENVSKDCLSVSSLTNAVIDGNIVKNSYSFLYTNVIGCSDFVISNNVCHGSGPTNPTEIAPNAIDLPYLTNSVVIGNVCDNWDACGIGIFTACENIIVANNVCTNNAQDASVWPAGICVGRIGATTAPSNITLINNICRDNQGAPTQTYGILIDADITNVQIINNYLDGNVTSNLGVYTGADQSNDVALTANSQVTASVLIVDADPINGVLSSWRKIKCFESIKSSSPTHGIGYDTGAGGAVTQLTNKATATPAINTMCGDITMNNANLAADTSVTHTLTNSSILATDNIIITHISGGTLGAYNFAATPAAGSAIVTVHNCTPGALAEAIVYRFTIIRGAVT